MGLVNDEVKEVEISASGQLVQDALTLRKGERARFQLGEIG